MYSRLIGVAMVLAVSVAAPRVRGDDEQEANNARASAKAFVTALSKGDAAGARRYATSDDITGSLIEAVAPLIVAANKLQDATTAKFGPDANVFGGQMNPRQALARFMASTDDAEVRINGHEALLIPRPAAPAQQQPANGQADQPNQQDRQQPQQQQQQAQPDNQDQPADPPTNNNARNRPRGNPNQGIPMRKESERWKVDLSSIPNAEQIQQYAPMLRAVAEAMVEMSYEIRANNYDDASQLQPAFRQKMMAAVFAAMRGQ